VVPQNIAQPQNNAAQQPQNVAAQQQPQNNAAQQQPQNGVVAQQKPNDPFAAMALADEVDESVELMEQEDEFVADAAVADVAEEELVEAEEDLAFADFEDEAFVDAALADFEDAEFVDEALGDDEFAAMAMSDFDVEGDLAVAGDASTAPTTSSASNTMPSWGIALIVVGVLVLLGVVLVFVQLIRLLRA